MLNYFEDVIQARKTKNKVFDELGLSVKPNAAKGSSAGDAFKASSFKKIDMKISSLEKMNDEDYYNQLLKL